MLLFSVSSVDLTLIISVRDLALLTQKPGKALLLTIAKARGSAQIRAHNKSET